MALRDDIMAAVKDAMKSGDKKRLGTLRLMQAAIKDKDISSRTDGHDSALTPDTGISELFAKMVKQRQDSVTAYEQGNRPELAQAYQALTASIQASYPSTSADPSVTEDALKQAPNSL